mmetsp:Transcript_47726/g.139116  ORF Transcript_47726/g.139116 Transcript_47726/m.139116 type:complete len:649 (-) Transcript_47726:213-2159(-)
MGFFGRDSPFVKALEHVPVVSEVVQARHRACGNHEQAERARRQNIASRDGALTKLAEQIPVLNEAIVQPLHALSGNSEQLRRAQSRSGDLLSRDSPLVQGLEYIPVISDIVEARHRACGNHEQGERARQRNIASRDGALTQVAERIPLVNEMLVQPLHALHGNGEQLDRAQRVSDVVELGRGLQEAIDSLNRGEKVFAKNGFFARVAERVRYLDIAAFALHLKAGNYPQCMRAIYKDRIVTLSSNCLRVVLCMNPLGDLKVKALDVRHHAIEPSDNSKTAAFIKVLAQFFATSDDRLQATIVDRANASIKHSLSETLSDDYLGEQFEELRRTVLQPSLMALRQSNVCFAKLLPEFLPALPAALPAIMRKCVQELGVRRGTMRLPADAVAVEDPDAASAAARRMKAAAGGGVCCLLWYFGLVGASMGLVGLVVVLGVLFMRLLDELKCFPKTLNKRNHAAFAEVCGEGRQERQGVIVEVSPERLRDIGEVLSTYFERDYFHSSSLVGLLRSAEAMLAQRLDAVVKCDTIKVLHAIEIGEKEVWQSGDGDIGKVFLPATKALFEVDMKLAGGTRGVHATGARIFVPEDAVNKALERISHDLSRTDLRAQSEKLAKFDKISPRCRLEMDWLSDTEPVLEVRELQVSLVVPQ